MYQFSACDPTIPDFQFQCNHAGAIFVVPARSKSIRSIDRSVRRSSVRPCALLTRVFVRVGAYGNDDRPSRSLPNPMGTIHKRFGGKIEYYYIIPLLRLYKAISTLGCCRPQEITYYMIYSQTYIIYTTYHYIISQQKLYTLYTALFVTYHNNYQ